MLLAWSDPQLESCLVIGARLRDLAGDQAEAAEDLLSIVARAPRLSAITTFRSVRVSVTAGSLTFSVEEIDMHTRPFNPDGKPCELEVRGSLSSHGMSNALLVEDLRVRGESILRLASKFAAS